MRISVWSSDVCSSDLLQERRRELALLVSALMKQESLDEKEILEVTGLPPAPLLPDRPAADRKSVVQGKSVSVRVDLGRRGVITKKKTTTKYNILITSKSISKPHPNKTIHKKH